MSEAPDAGASPVSTGRSPVRLKLVVRVETGEQVDGWEREVQRPYLGIPGPDDWVYLGDGESGGLAAQPVSVVTWENDGTVALRFDVSGDGSWLETLGFRRVT